MPWPPEAVAEAGAGQWPPEGSDPQAPKPLWLHTPPPELVSLLEENLQLSLPWLPGHLLRNPDVGSAPAFSPFTVCRILAPAALIRVGLCPPRPALQTRPALQRGAETGASGTLPSVREQREHGASPTAQAGCLMNAKSPRGPGPWRLVAGSGRR